MNFITKLLVPSALLLSFISYGQNVEFKSSNFKDKKEDFKKALVHFEKAEELIEQGNEFIYSVLNPGNTFKSAIIELKKAHKFNPKNARVNFMLGNAYLYTNEKYKALSYLEKAVKLNPEVDRFTDFYLGMAYQLDMDFSKAIKHYTKFESATKSKHVETLGRMLKKRIKECKSGKVLTAKPVRAWIDNVKSINSKSDEYSPCISTDGATIVFTSNRENGHKANEVGEYDGDIYKTDLQENGKWSSPKTMGSTLNTTLDETATMLSYNGTKMLIYKNEGEDYDIYESVLKGVNWTSPKKLHRGLNTKADQTYASYNFNDRKIMFVSSKKVGNSSRGTDIFFCGRMNGRKDEFGAAQTVGSTVNSRFNEGSVYMHPDGETMYFSSEGHNSMGGMDIFVSYKKQGSWSEPENLGYPINTPYDDYFFAATASGKYAYIASNREGGKGGLDIYKITFWGTEKNQTLATEDYLLASVATPIKNVQIENKVKVNKKSLTVFKGKTIDAISNKAIEAKITITDNTSGRKIETIKTNSATGKFLLSLPSGKNYGITVEADGYLFHSENFDIKNGGSFNMVNKVVKLKNIKKGSTIALRNIFFDSGKSILSSESNGELNRLVALLKEVSSLKIEISGHTDNVGSESLNKKLSQKRAQAVVDYLTQKGIAKTRLVAKGYGSIKPVASNNSSSGRQQNRRTEFKIL